MLFLTKNYDKKFLCQLVLLIHVYEDKNGKGNTLTHSFILRTYFSIIFFLSSSHRRDEFLMQRMIHWNGSNCTNKQTVYFALYFTRNSQPVYRLCSMS